MIVEESERGSTYSHEHLNNPLAVRGEYLVTSIRVEKLGAHERVIVYTRGQNAGMLIVNPGDGKLIAERLLK